MEKRVIVNENKKTVVVLLINEYRQISAKGIARCSAEDTFNKDKGLSLANTRAWINYYKSQDAFLDRQLKLIQENIDNYKKYLDNKTEMSKIVKSKLAGLEKDYKEIISVL